MRRRAVLHLALIALLLSACSYGDSDEAEPETKLVTAIIETDDEPVMLDVEVAQTQAEREKGLMKRKSLAEDSGMVFFFFEPTSNGFWMKDTLIPLSIAFFDDDGKILKILDMDPCKKNPCKIYYPDVTYFGALEVNQGAFDEWHVEVGDEISANV
jgi:uncharacterized protein